ncbi:MAG: hypothetical protein HUK12_05795 [Muribaculaceae bacterium]|nr:hypothetical protein [Muribaculaceae bacterium]
MTKLAKIAAIALIGLWACKTSAPTAQQLSFEQAESMLYNPLSEKYDEEAFIAFAQNYIKDQEKKGATLTREKLLLEQALKNRIHSVAADFTYALPDGSKHQMHDITSSFTILFFNNPDCEECGEIKHEIANSPIIDNLVKNNSLTILAICPLSLSDDWSTTVYPQNVVNALDFSGDVEDRLYDIRQIPSLYLLDSEKRVVAKNIPLSKALQIITN